MDLAIVPSDLGLRVPLTCVTLRLRAEGESQESRVSSSKKCDVTYRCLEIRGATTPLLLGFQYYQAVLV